MEYYQPAAEMGNAMALYDMGNVYEVGADHIEKDPKKAFSCLEKSANLGYPVAQNMLGQKYWCGDEEMQKNPEMAFTYYRLGDYSLKFWPLIHFLKKKKKLLKLDMQLPN